MKDHIDRIIQQSMESSIPPIEIDIRRETMSRIKFYELKKSKIRVFFQYALLFFSSLSSLAAIVFAETLFNRLRLTLMLAHINPQTLKLIYQGFCACAFIGLFILMIVALNENEDEAFFSGVIAGVRAEPPSHLL